MIYSFVFITSCIFYLIPNPLNEVKDERVKVKNPHEYPNCTSVFMEMIFGNGHNKNTYIGSGVMVGPRHLLTAAHNVYNKNKKEWVNNIKASPGANGDQAFFDTTYAIKAFVDPSYLDNDEEGDIALLILKDDLGKYTGWARIQALDDKEFEDMQFYVSGYPGDKERANLWEMKGKILETEKNVLRYDIKTYKGQSGSPLWRKSEPPTVFGIHVRGNYVESKNCHNEATRISRDKLKWIANCFRFSGEKTKHQIEEENYLKAAEQGHAKAQYNLGDLYKNQYKNYEEAKKWYLKAAEQDHADAQYSLGLLLYEKQKKCEEAKKWYLEAAKQGNADAQNALKKL